MGVAAAAVGPVAVADQALAADPSGVELGAADPSAEPGADPSGAAVLAASAVGPFVGTADPSGPCPSWAVGVVVVARPVGLAWVCYFVAYAIIYL
jgi:hypothetical protein